MPVQAIAAHSRATPQLFHDRVATPALVYDLDRLGTFAGVARKVREQSEAGVLYAVKACAFSDVLQVLAPSVDGFAVSSLFEARLLRDLYPDSPLHLTTPGLRDDEVEEACQDMQLRDVQLRDSIAPLRTASSPLYERRSPS